VSDTPSLLPAATDFLFRSKNCSGVPPASWEAGVAHPIEPLPDVGCADASSAQTNRPDGVTFVLQVSRYSVVPGEPSRARNLLPNNDDRSENLQELEESGPEVSLVFSPLSSPCDREGLAGTAGGDDRALVGPPTLSQDVGPDADPGEEMVLDEPPEIFNRDISDIPLVHVTRCDVLLRNEISQPLGRVRIVLVVIGIPH